jgi:hypothetical protein
MYDPSPICVKERIQKLCFYRNICKLPLKLSTFNYRGIQDYVKRRKIFHYLRSIDSDIIFLQETHSVTDQEQI